ncbi:MAG: PIN domain-containing protein [Sulfolobales archaeon]
MIIDTMYLLPLVGISIKTDLLKAIVERKIKRDIDLRDIKINTISLFELQAKASKIGVSVERVIKAINAIYSSLKLISFHDSEIIRYSFEIRKIIPDYIDCVIVATAIVLREELVTEDRMIIGQREYLKKTYGLEIYDYKDIVEK